MDHLFLSTVTLLFIIPNLSPAPAAAAGMAGNGRSTEFIRTSCQATRFPAICFSSLSAYAGSVQQSHSQLARIAISVSLSKVKAASSFLGNLSISPAPAHEPRVKMALQDCTKTFNQASNQMVQSLNEFHLLFAGNFGWHIDNIQTWMSAALTNEQTCIDGFEGVSTGAGLSLKAAVTNKVSDVSMVTSNALALVNCLAIPRR